MSTKKPPSDNKCVHKKVLNAVKNVGAGIAIPFYVVGSFLKFFFSKDFWSD